MQCVPTGRSRGARHALCIGGANRDEVMRLAAPVELGTSNRVHTTATTGGVARNVAQNLAALGIAARLVAAVGEDAEGAALLAETEAAGVDTGLCFRRAGSVTGRYVAVLDRSGELVIGLADMAATESLEPSDVDALAAAFDGIAAVYADANLLPGTLAAVRHQCDWHGVPLMLDMVSPGKARRLGEAAFCADLLAGNRYEAAAATGETGDLERLARALVVRGAGAAIVSGGGEGVAWADASGSGHLPAPPARVIDVTGAGDALQAGILAARLEGATLAGACAAGLVAARRVIETEGHALSRAPAPGEAAW